MERTVDGGNVLVTGATGLIGGEILARLLGGRCRRVWALARPTPARTPAERVAGRLARAGVPVGGDSPPLRAVAGDVTQPGWGMAPADLRAVCGRVDVIVHNAADTSFAADRDTGRTNVDGVRHLVALARACPRPPLVVYMSTASNVGEEVGRCVGEDDGCRPAAAHFNGYTRSKAVAEELLRASGLPLLVLRPSIVLSRGLADPRFARQILWCVPLTRAFRALPLDPDGRLDVVDVGYVADAAVALMRSAARAHDCYHLSAGPAGAARLGDLAAVADRAYARQSPLELVPPAGWDRAAQRAFVRTPLQRRVFRSLRHYLPFLNMDVVYDDARARADLGPGGPRVRPVGSYLAGLLALIPARAALREAAVP